MDWAHILAYVSGTVDQDLSILKTLSTMKLGHWGVDRYPAFRAGLGLSLDFYSARAPLSSRPASIGIDRPASSTLGPPANRHAAPMLAPE